MRTMVATTTYPAAMLQPRPRAPDELQHSAQASAQAQRHTTQYSPTLQDVDACEQLTR